MKTTNDESSAMREVLEVKARVSAWLQQMTPDEQILHVNKTAEDVLKRLGLPPMSKAHRP